MKNIKILGKIEDIISWIDEYCNGEPSLYKVETEAGDWLITCYIGAWDIYIWPRYFRPKNSIKWLDAKKHPTNFPYGKELVQECMHLNQIIPYL